MTAAEDIEEAKRRNKKAKEELEDILSEHSEDALELAFQLHRNENPVLELPRRALEALHEILEILEDGSDVDVVPKDRELTTTEAAEMLNVSRPHLVDLLENGDIPYHKVGSHRRVRLADLLEYKHEQKRQSRERMEAPAREGERLDIGD